MNLLQINVLPTDSIVPPKVELSQLQSMSLDEIMTKTVNAMVHFAGALLLAIVVFYVGKFIIKKLYGLTHKILVRRNVDLSLMTFVLSLIRMVLYFILIVTVIGILGIETSSFIALFASAGVAVGMALSGTLQNFAGGVLILLLKPYKVGDYIEAQGFSGTVKSIQIFNTLITTPDNKSIIIPNGGLSTGSILNWSQMDYRRVDWTVSLAYGDDVDRAKKEIMDILLSDPRVVKDYTEETPPGLETANVVKTDRRPTVALGSLAASSIDMTVRAWVKSVDYWPVFFDLNERFYKELPEKGLNFPFPQLDVHLSSN